LTKGSSSPLRNLLRGALLLASCSWASGAYAQALPDAAAGESTGTPSVDQATESTAPASPPPPPSPSPVPEQPPQPARVSGAPEREQSSPRAKTTANRPGVGLLAAAGLHNGLGLGARLGLGDVGLEVTGGYQLLYALWDTGSARDRKVDVGSSAQLGSELYFTPWHPGATSAVGLKAGYRYNSVLEHGFAAAITFLATLSPHLAFEGLAGAQVFPGSEGRLKRKLDVPSGANIAYGSQAQYFEYGFELIWYP